jgi:uncharacterized protein YjbJ (UPF0337 family)
VAGKQQGRVTGQPQERVTGQPQETVTGQQQERVTGQQQEKVTGQQQERVTGQPWQPWGLEMEQVTVKVTVILRVSDVLQVVIGEVQIISGVPEVV